MQKHPIPHRQLKRKGRKSRACMRLFRKIRLWYVRRQIRARVRDHSELLILLPEGTLSETISVQIRDLVLEWRSIGYQVQAKQVPMHTPTGKLGELRWYYETRLIRQESLLIQPENASIEHDESVRIHYASLHFLRQFYWNYP